MEKEQFLNELKDILKNFNFDETSNTYNKSIQKQTPGQRININGQETIIPGQVININITVDDMGEGFINDEELRLLGFIIKQNNNIQEVYEFFKFDELEKIKTYINNILR